MFNWIFKKIASYVTVTTPEIDYAKLAEAINIEKIASNFDDMDMAIAIAAQLSEENIADKINLKKLANHIDISEIANNFSENDLAEKITSTIAEQFFASDIAAELSASDIAAELDIEKIAQELANIIVRRLTQQF